jgi:hypothetical protein
MDHRAMSVAVDLDALLAGSALIPVETEKLRFHGVALKMKFASTMGYQRRN